MITEITQLDAQGQPIDDAAEAALEAERLALVEGAQCFFDLAGAADAKRLGEAA